MGRIFVNQYSRLIDSGEAVEVLAIGDSWFHYPHNNLISPLHRALARPTIYVIGDNDARADELCTDAWLDVFIRMLHDYPSIRLICVSAGFNDYFGVGNLDSKILQPDCSNATTAEACFQPGQPERASAGVKASYRVLLDAVSARRPGLHVLLHNYDYAIPDGRTLPGLRSGLKLPMDNTRVPGAGPPLEGIRREVVSVFTDGLTLLADNLQAEYGGGTKARAEMVWSAGTLGEGDWASELHPRPDAFDRLCREAWSEPVRRAMGLPAAATAPVKTKGSISVRTFDWIKGSVRNYGSTDAMTGFESRRLPESFEKVTGDVEAPEAFHFVLRGPAARGNTIAAGSVAALIFDYDVPPADALAVANAPALDDAKKANAEMFLVLTAQGPVAVIGTPIGRAQFEGGTLLKPVSFDLQAGTEPDDARLHIAFLVRGELVHQTEIEIKVVDHLASAQDPSIPTRADGMLSGRLERVVAAASAPPEQRIVLSLSFAGGALRLSLTDFRRGELEFSDDYQSAGLDATRVETMLRRIHGDLKWCYEDEDFWSQFDGTMPEGEERRIADDALAQTMERVAVAGSRLNGELRSDARIAEALDYIEKNGMQGAVISVSTDNTFLPWELLYPDLRSPNMSDEERASNPLAPQRFWGARFAVETEKRGIGSLIKLRDEHVKVRPKVTVNLNPLISIKGVAADRQPLAVQRTWAERLAQRGQLDGIQDTCKDVRPVLQGAVKDSTFIYVYCHGSSPDAFSGIDEALVLDAKCSLEPRDLQGRPAYRGAPIVFLNSCKGGVSSPLSFSGFLKEFRARGALGIIATSFSVPIAFGASFGQAVVDCYLNRKGSLAIEMLDLRRLHLLERGNPVPLFYTLQCHLDAAAAA